MRIVMAVAVAVAATGCAKPPPPAAPAFALETFRRTGIPLREVSRRKPAIRGPAQMKTKMAVIATPKARRGKVPKVLALVPELAALGSRIGQPPSLNAGCMPITVPGNEGAGALMMESCLGAPLPAPLADAFVTEQIDDKSRTIVAVIAEQSAMLDSDGELGYQRLAAALQKAYGPASEVEVGHLKIKAGPYSVILEQLPGPTPRIALELRSS